MTLTLTSPAFRAGGPIPKRYADVGEGDNRSPPLEWTGVPPAARELALICDDPDAPTPLPWVHWVLHGIPSIATGLAEGDTGAALHGRNGWDKHGWGGPMPPRGSGPHRYVFRLFALDAPLGLGGDATKGELVVAMRGHVLAQACLTGTYERR